MIAAFENKKARVRAVARLAAWNDKEGTVVRGFTLTLTDTDTGKVAGVLKYRELGDALDYGQACAELKFQAVDWVENGVR